MCSSAARDSDNSEVFDILGLDKSAPRLLLQRKTGDSSRQKSWKVTGPSSAGVLPKESLGLDQSFQNNLMKTDFSCRAFWISMPLVTLWTQISLKYAAEAVIRVHVSVLDVHCSRPDHFIRVAPTTARYFYFHQLPIMIIVMIIIVVIFTIIIMIRTINIDIIIILKAVSPRHCWRSSSWSWSSPWSWQSSSTSISSWKASSLKALLTR